MPQVFEWQMLAGKAADRCYVNGREDSGPTDAVFIHSERVNWLPSVGHAPPTQGKAHKMALKMLATRVGVPKPSYPFLRGLISRRKLFRGRAQSPNRRAYPGRCGAGEKSHLP